MGVSVTVPASTLERYEAFTLYNSPYPAHDAGRAIDLYPGTGRGGTAPSPVAGTVTETLTTRAPTREYAAPEDHLIVIDTGTHLARLLHVAPAVAPGDTVAVGDPLGSTVRSGYFAPWVDNHIHLGFRPPAADPRRASGSLRLDLGVDVEPVPWDGTGTVRERGGTYVVLDAPGHPAPGERFAGLAADAGGVLDGGLPHYEFGGLLGGADGPVRLLGTPIGTATDRTVPWADVTVRVDGRPATGIALGCHRDRLGVKVVAWDGFDVAPGEAVTVTVETAPATGTP